METIDILNRKKFIAQLIEITENISKNKKSTSFAIDGPWGCGKSFVLKEFQKQLEPVQSSENYMDKYFVVKYNCWEYDY